MYSFKEKKKHLEELSNREAAQADLLLLKQVQPALLSIRTFERNPQRYAQDILYTLLDYRTREEIRTYRRDILNQDKLVEVPATTVNDKQLDDEATDDDKEKSEDDSRSSQENTEKTEVDAVSKAELDEIKEQLQEAEERAEVAEDEKKELQEELEYEQLACEQAEQALEEEKKKEPKKPIVKKESKDLAKSRSTKSTHK